MSLVVVQSVPCSGVNSEYVEKRIADMAQDLTRLTIGLRREEGFRGGVGAGVWCSQ